MSKPLHGLRDGFGPVLVGMRGSGKSSVAPLLAERLQMKAIDADAELELRAGRSIPTIFAEDGEPEFRRIERTLLLDDLLRRNDTVIATGGGAVLDSEVRERLRQRLTVWLHAPVDVLARRIGGSDRPSLTGKAIDDELAEVLAKREALYRDAARLVVETSNKSVAQIVDDIAREALGEDR
jgi:shikimate kinase